MSAYSLVFQSTHPHRVRHYILTRRYLEVSFNPHTHIGCDLPAGTLLRLLYLFQSTHPHRVRREIRRYIEYDIKFQSTHPHRVRQSKILSSIPEISFNPHTHIGCDNFTLKIATLLPVSIHTPT